MIDAQTSERRVSMVICENAPERCAHFVSVESSRPVAFVQNDVDDHCPECGGDLVVIDQ